MMRILLILNAVFASLWAVSAAPHWTPPGLAAVRPAGLRAVGDELASYRRVLLEWPDWIAGGPFTGRHDVAVRLADSDGALTVCGFLVRRHHGISDRALAQLADARLEIGAWAIPARFLHAQSDVRSERDATANCVATDLPWSPDLADLPLRVALAR